MTSNTRRLRQRIALVTGAARGIGAAIADAFAAEGATVFVTDIREADGRAVAARLAGRGHFLTLDVRSEAAWEVAVAEVVRSAGRIDILVNNAGITGFDQEDGAGPPPRHDPEHVSLSAWHAVLTTNLDGVLLGCRYALRTMRSHPPSGRGGSIINLGSRSGLVGIPRAAAYAASKAAIRNHTRSVALYAAEEGIPARCNAIHPAAILTPMWEPLLGQGADRAARMAEFVKDTPLRRFGTVEEVAALAVYLASDESAYTTGTDFMLDGGLLAGTATPPAPAE
jgi:NAD(P)-dependent dehydrogenase (short-subunit alcohol dehydrogenase family)